MVSSPSASCCSALIFPSGTASRKQASRIPCARRSAPRSFCSVSDGAAKPPSAYTIHFPQACRPPHGISTPCDFFSRLLTVVPGSVKKASSLIQKRIFSQLSVIFYSVLSNRLRTVCFLPASQQSGLLFVLCFIIFRYSRKERVDILPFGHRRNITSGGNDKIIMRAAFFHHFQRHLPDRFCRTVSKLPSRIYISHDQSVGIFSSASSILTAFPK